MALAHSTSVRVGIAGLGNFGKLHTGVLARLPQAEIAAVCDPDERAVQEVGDRFGIADRFATYDAMLDGAALDAVFLVTPEPMHEQQALTTIARGLPVFTEKPLATSATMGRQVADAAQAAGVYIQVGFVLRFETRHALLKQELDRGRFGDIVSVRVKRNCSRAWMDLYGDRAHNVHENEFHDIDLLLWYIGAPCESVYAISRHLTGHRFPDATFALLQFQGGATALVETSWFIPAGGMANVLTDAWAGTIDAELELVGTEQTARFQMLDSGLEIWTSALTTAPEPGLWPEINGHVTGALREEDAHFLDCVRTGAASSVTSIEDAVQGLRIAEAIIESAESGLVVKL